MLNLRVEDLNHNKFLSDAFHQSKQEAEAAR